MGRAIFAIFAVVLTVSPATSRADAEGEDLLLELERELSLQGYFNESRCGGEEVIVHEPRQIRRNFTEQDYRSEQNLGAEGTPNIQGAAGTPNIPGAGGTPLVPGAGSIKRERRR